VTAFHRLLFRLALRLHASADRARYGAEMERIFTEDVARARMRGRWRAFVVAIRETLDIARTGVGERWNDAAERRAEGKVRRTAKGASGMDNLSQDLRFALRSLLRRPAFTAMAVLTVAAGIGATTTIFSVVNGVLLRSLPYAEPERLVSIWGAQRDDAGGPFGGSVSPVVFKDWQAQSQSFATMAVWTNAQPTLTGLGDPEVIAGARVSPDFFRVFEAEPVLGRALTAEEDLPEGPLGVVISHGFWQERLGGARDVLDQTLELNGRRHSIVGVAAAGFEYPAGARLWLAVRNDDENCSRGCVYLNTVARLKPGTTLLQARQEMAAIADRLSEAFPAQLKNVTVALNGLQETIVGDVRRALWLLLGAVGMVLLIACANVANLLIARGATRSDELAVRVALGAGRQRIVRHLMTESFLLALVGAFIGMGLSEGGVRALRALSPGNIPRLAEVDVDGTALVFSMGLAILTALVFGLVPALSLARSSVAGVIRDDRARTTGGRHGRGRALLLAAEVGLSLVLLVGAGLLLRSFASMQQIDPGYAIDGIARFTLSLPGTKYAEPEDAVRFFEQLETRLDALPGVTGTTQVIGAPLSTTSLVTSLTRTDRPAPAPGETPSAYMRVVGHDYHEILDVAVVAGRSFAPTDRPDAPPVAIINRKLAAELYPGEDPLGKALNVGVSIGFPETDARTIIGIVEDVRTADLIADPQPELYMPAAQVGSSFATLLIAAREPERILSTVRQEVHALDADLPIRNPGTLSDLFQEHTARPRFYLALLALFAVLAVLLAAVGLYGVVAFLVAQRQREIGVRIALGARAGDVLRMVLREGLRPAALGAAAGLAVAAGGTRIMRALLYDVAPTDPFTFAGTTLLLLSIVTLACLIPAGRATRIAPAAALKTGR
jgi:putative ABC transport system permease protein